MGNEYFIAKFEDLDQMMEFKEMVIKTE